MTECEHEEYEMVGKFPSNMFVVGSCIVNKVKCTNCGEIGREYYKFTERSFKGMDK